MTAVLLGAFVFIHVFLRLALADRFAVLTFVTKETWLLVLLLWAKDLALAALSAFAAAWLFHRLFEVPDGSPSGRDEGLPRRSEGAAVGAILALGILLRWIAIDAIPPGVWEDTVLETESALRDPSAVPWWGAVPFNARSGSHELTSNLWVHYGLAVYRVFGRTRTGFLAVSAIPGSLALLALWAFARELYGRHVALAALFLFALARWPLILSRSTSIVVALVFLSLAASAASLYALRTRRALAALAAGIATGLLFHTHASAPAVAVALAIFWAAQVWRTPGLSRPAVWAFAGALAAFVPFGMSLFHRPGDVGGHLRDTNVLAATKLVTIPAQTGPFAVPIKLGYNLYQYSGFFLFTPGEAPTLSVPGDAAASLLVGSAMLLGAASLLVRLSRAPLSSELLPALLVGAGLASGVFAEATLAPLSSRAAAAAGPLYVLAALALVRAADRVRVSGLGRGVFWAALAAYLVTFETARVLAVWPFDARVSAGFESAATDAGERLRLLGTAEVIRDPALTFKPRWAWVVIEALAGPGDASVPLPVLPARSAAELVREGRPAPFWYVSSPASLHALEAGGFRAARPVAAGDGRSDLVLARVVPAPR